MNETVLNKKDYIMAKLFGQDKINSAVPATPPVLPKIHEACNAWARGHLAAYKHDWMAGVLLAHEAQPEKVLRQMGYQINTTAYYAAMAGLNFGRKYYAQKP